MRLNMHMGNIAAVAVKIIFRKGGFLPESGQHRLNKLCVYFFDHSDILFCKAFVLHNDIQCFLPFQRVFQGVSGKVEPVDKFFRNTEFQMIVIEKNLRL